MSHTPPFGVCDVRNERSPMAIPSDRISSALLALLAESIAHTRDETKPSQSQSSLKSTTFVRVRPGIRAETQREYPHETNQSRQT